MILGPAVFDRHVSTLDVARFTQAKVKRTHNVREQVRRCGIEEANHRHRRLLCERGERPRGGGAAEKRDELAPFHLLPHKLVALQDDKG